MGTRKSSNAALFSEYFHRPVCESIRFLLPVFLPTARMFSAGIYRPAFTVRCPATL